MSLNISAGLRIGMERESVARGVILMVRMETCAPGHLLNEAIIKTFHGADDHAGLMRAPLPESRAA